jgi:hypothetical protein
LAPPEQPQTPLLQALAPAGQALQPPQWAVEPSPPAVMQDVPHISGMAGGHIEAQVVPLHTCPAEQTLVQLPQWEASDAMQLPLQSSRPELQTQVPF